MIDSLPLFFAVTGLVAFIIGLAKGGFGGTIGALATPLMALVLPNEPVVGTVLPLLMVADVFAVAAHWRQWEFRLIRLLLPGAIIGVTIGTWFITNAPTETLRTALGVIVLLFVAYKLLEARIMRSLTYEPRDWHGIIAGGITGFSSSLAHIGSPPISIYMLLQDVTPRVFVATAALFFMILNAIKVPYYIYADLFNFERIWQIIWLGPLMPFGVWVGKLASTRIDKDTFEWIIVGMLAVTAVLLIFF